MKNNISPIVTREMFLVDNPSKKFKIELYMPVKHSDGFFRCKIHIDGAPEGLGDIDIGGFDAYDALLKAISTVPTMVEVFNKKHMNNKLRVLPNSDKLYLELAFEKPKVE